MIGLITQVIPLERIFIMATPDFKSMILEQVPGILENNILIEPARRDNGPAITLGMLQIEQRDPEAEVGIFWSDHRIERPEAFKQAVEAAFAAVENYADYLIIVGANVTRPDTALGYIQMDKELGTYAGVRVFSAVRFIEKPDLPTARRFQSSWGYLWNVGYSVMKVDAFFRSLAEVQPDLRETLANLKQVISQPNVTANDIAPVYEGFEKISIDYLFTQKLTKLAVVPSDMGWSDIGTWEILHEVLASSHSDNMVTKGDVTAIGTTHSLIYAKDKPIAVVGMENVIVVDTGDAILVMNRTAPSSLVKDLTKHFSNTKPELL